MNEPAGCKFSSFRKILLGISELLRRSTEAGVLTILPLWIVLQIRSRVFPPRAFSIPT